MKKLSVLAFVFIAAAGVFLGAKPVEAQTAPAEAELSPEVAHTLKLALDATELVLDEIELQIKDENASVDAAAVGTQLNSMKGALVALDMTLDGSPALAVAPPVSPSPSVAVQPTAPIAQAPLVTAPTRPEPVAEPEDGDEAPALAEDSSESDEAVTGNLASVGDTLGSGKVIWPIAIILIALVVYFGFFFRRNAGKPKAPAAPAKASS